MAERLRQRLAQVPLHLLLALAVVVMGVPFYWVVTGALKTNQEIYRFPPGWIPREPHWENFVEAWDTAPFGRFYLNSIVTTLAGSGLELLFALTSAYALVFLRVRVAGAAFLLILAALLSSCSSGGELPGNQGPASSPSSSPTLPTTTGTPAVVSSTGSRVRMVYWGSFGGDLGKAEQAVVQRFNESQDDVELVYQYQGSYEETAQTLAQAVAARQTSCWSPMSGGSSSTSMASLRLLDDFFQARQIDPVQTMSTR